MKVAKREIKKVREREREKKYNREKSKVRTGQKINSEMNTDEDKRVIIEKDEVWV